MRELELDLPLAGTAASRFLQWIVVGLTLLAVCAFAVGVAGDAAVREAARRPAMVTLAIAISADRAAEAEQRLLQFLRARPGVLYAEPVPESELAGLSDPQPAAGHEPQGGLLLLPRLIDVALRPAAIADLGRFEAELRELVPEVTVGAASPPTVTHAIGRIARAVGIGLGVAVLAVAGVTTILVTRNSLDRHEETVDLLRLMGASDRYVARQFELHALTTALRGAALGFAAGVLAFLAVVELARRFGGGIGQEVALRPVHWVLLATVPVVMVLLVTLSARTAAFRGLARLR